MNRFLQKKEPREVSGIPIIFSLLFFALVLILFGTGVAAVSADHIEKQEESLETALARNIVHCYALEGAYPPNLEYMEEHYGLAYDKELFFVDYQVFASNLYPEVTVIRRTPSLRIPVLNKSVRSTERF